jgi:hypothetical protein
MVCTGWQARVGERELDMCTANDICADELHDAATITPRKSGGPRKSFTSYICTGAHDKLTGKAHRQSKDTKRSHADPTI